MAAPSVESTPRSKISHSVEGAAEITSLSRSRLYLDIGSGKLRSFKIGKRRLVTDEALVEYIRNLEAQGGAA